MSLTKDILDVIDKLHQLATAQHVQIATAESCTSGLLGYYLTYTPGSSAYYLGGVNSYANEAKKTLLGVDQQALDAYGAVSKQVAEAMAEGVRIKLNADIGLSITGIAGPGGGSASKPVGTVWIALADQQNVISKKLSLSGDRHAVRNSATYETLRMLLEYYSNR